jgi:hypothetical protein
MIVYAWALSAPHSVSAGLEQIKGGKYRTNGKNNWSTGVQSMDFEEIQSQFEAGSKHMKLLWLATERESGFAKHITDSLRSIYSTILAAWNHEHGTRL